MGGCRGGRERADQIITSELIRHIRAMPVASHALLVVVGLLVAVAPSAAWSNLPQFSRRAVFSGGAAALAGPMPAFARSKEKAAEKALQKQTAAEARQAMKEYKYAPRPELVGSAETGYSYKEGTVKAGSTGELSSYFSDKGAVLQSKYAEDKARANGMSALEAKKVAEEKEAKLRAEKAAALARRKEVSADEKKIAEFCLKNPDALDNVGRRQCK
jgi:hypothetical protein